MARQLLAVRFFNPRGLAATSAITRRKVVLIASQMVGKQLRSPAQHTRCGLCAPVMRMREGNCGGFRGASNLMQRFGQTGRANLTQTWMGEIQWA